jgi:hypothetical protein
LNAAAYDVVLTERFLRVTNLIDRRPGCKTPRWYRAS